MRQALIALEIATTRELFEYVWPRLALDRRWPCWRWRTVRRSAERYAERVAPRTNPLTWRAKPGLIDDGETG